MINPRDARQLERFLVYDSYPPYDIQWVDCGIAAIKAIDAGEPEKWIDLPMTGHQMTAQDVAAFLHISNYLTVAESRKKAKHD